MGSDNLTRYVRFSVDSKVAYGLLEEDTVHELAGDIFSDPQKPANPSHYLVLIYWFP